MIASSKVVRGPSAARDAVLEGEGHSSLGGRGGDAQQCLRPRYDATAKFKALDAADLAHAKDVLGAFDLVLVSDLMVPTTPSARAVDRLLHATLGLEPGALGVRMKNRGFDTTLPRKRDDAAR